MCKFISICFDYCYSKYVGQPKSVVETKFWEHSNMKHGWCLTAGLKMVHRHKLSDFNKVAILFYWWKLFTTLLYIGYVYFCKYIRIHHTSRPNICSMLNGTIRRLLFFSSWFIITEERRISYIILDSLFFINFESMLVFFSHPGSLNAVWSLNFAGSSFYCVLTMFNYSTTIIMKNRKLILFASLTPLLIWRLYSLSYLCCVWWMQLIYFSSILFLNFSFKIIVDFDYNNFTFVPTAPHQFLQLLLWNCLILFELTHNVPIFLILYLILFIASPLIFQILDFKIFPCYFRWFEPN